MYPSCAGHRSSSAGPVVSAAVSDTERPWADPVDVGCGAADAAVQVQQGRASESRRLTTPQECRWAEQWFTVHADDPPGRLSPLQ